MNIEIIKKRVIDGMQHYYSKEQVIELLNELSTQPISVCR